MAADDTDFRNWKDPEIGWGLLLPENEDLSEAERAVAADAPEPIRNLLAARPGSPVFRYRPGTDVAFLRRYYADDPKQDVSVFGERGIARSRFPHYLLIVASPAEIPWAVQFFLNQACFVGRLDLDPVGLANYVEALKNDFGDSACKPSQPVVWAVNHGPDDITALMSAAIARPLKERLEGDNQIGNQVEWRNQPPTVWNKPLGDTVDLASPCNFFRDRRPSGSTSDRDLRQEVKGFQRWALRSAFSS